VLKIAGMEGYLCPLQPKTCRFDLTCRLPAATPTDIVLQTTVRTNLLSLRPHDDKGQTPEPLILQSVWRLFGLYCSPSPAVLDPLNSRALP